MVPPFVESKSSSSKEDHGNFAYNADLSMQRKSLTKKTTRKKLRRPKIKKIRIISVYIKLLPL